MLDGRSHSLVWREATDVYRQILAGATPALPPGKPFREFASWLAENSQETAPAYWRACLRSFQAPTELPSLCAAPDAGDDDAAPLLETRSLSAELTAHLQEAARRLEVTLNSLVQGAWALALGRYQGVDEVVFGIVRSCRHWTEDGPNDRVGMFINTIPFHVDVAPGQPVGAWLRGLREQQMAVRAGEYASAAQIRRWCGLPKSAGLVRSCLMFENRDPAEVMSGAGQCVQVHGKTDLPTIAGYAGNVLTLTFESSPVRHASAQLQFVLRHMERLLESLAAAAPDSRLGDLEMMTAEDHRMIFEEWQGPTAAEPAPPIHRLLEAQAGQTPDAPAVEFLGRSLTYAEFHRQANQLARRLLQSCQAGDRIAVVLEQGLDQPIVWLATLKAGLVYAPVDPINPHERLEFVFKDLQPAMLVTQQSLLALLPTGTPRLLCVDSPDERAALAALDTNHLPADPPADSTINLLYTSGSTGNPKAASNSRAGLDNFAADVRNRFDFGPHDRVLQSSSTSFDASIYDFVAALQCGATLVLAPAEQFRPGPVMGRMLNDLRITTSLFTPNSMRSTPPPPPPLLRPGWFPPVNR